MRADSATVTLPDAAREALSLPIGDRVPLAQSLWGSIEGGAGFEIVQAWAVRAGRRWCESKEGKVQCQRAEEAMGRVRERLRP